MHDNSHGSNSSGVRALRVALVVLVALVAVPAISEATPPESRRREGRSVTILMTLSNPHASPKAIEALVEDTVVWVGGKARPRVLVVRDDNHNNEFAQDASYVQELLLGRGFEVTLIEEPVDGLTMAEAQGFEVIWFSNPGHAIDDVASMKLLLELARSGRAGVVVQGDDASQGVGFSMEALTGLRYVHNGTSLCGVAVDNNVGGLAKVGFGASAKHPAVRRQQGEMGYGDDIDATEVVGKASVVLAWARGECDERWPVVVARRW